MDKKEQITIMILEDDLNTCAEIQNYTKGKKEYKIVAQTTSSKEALELLKNKNPKVIIVDIELHNGEGSGISFLKALPTLPLLYKPFIIVNTNIISEKIYDEIHSSYADIILYKKQPNYSIDMIFEAIDFVFKSTKPQQTQKNIVDKEEIISNIINNELDKFGASYKLKGRVYMYEALYYLLTNSEEEIRDIPVFQYLSNKHKILVGSIARAIQTAINTAWRTMPLEDLEELYTAKINYHTGVPTPTEFIYYLHEKIKKLT